MKERCLQQIIEIKSLAANNLAAYTYRSRLGRLIVSCLRSVTRDLGIAQPTLPGLFTKQLDMPLIMVNVINSCNKLWELSRVLSQPSEPLEERWKFGWEKLNRELDVLYNLINNVHI